MRRCQLLLLPLLPHCRAGPGWCRTAKSPPQSCPTACGERRERMGSSAAQIATAEWRSRSGHRCLAFPATQAWRTALQPLQIPEHQCGALPRAPKPAMPTCAGCTGHSGAVTITMPPPNFGMETATRYKSVGGKSPPALDARVEVVLPADVCGHIRVPRLWQAGKQE